MKIGNLLRKENIVKIEKDENLSKTDIIKLLIDNITTSYKNEEFGEELENLFLEKVLKRENQCSTGLGEGLAFPHGRILGLNKPIIALGIIKNGMDFESIDKKKVKHVFLFLFPGNRHDLGVKIQAVLARFLVGDKKIEEINNATSIDEIHQIVLDADLAVDTPVTAQDLMCKTKIKLSNDMPVLDATSLMNNIKTEVAPIVNENNIILGEIDCIHLFQMDLPDYIKDLKSVPPIHDFKPFNKYFSTNSSLLIKDVMNNDVAKVELDASLMEIIFLLTVKKYSIVYVCNNGELKGTIDRITVLDKVFNL